MWISHSIVNPELMSIGFVVLDYWWGGVALSA